MDVKQAVQSARAYVLDLFEDETLDGLVLEEVEWDDSAREGQVTLSFCRPLPATPLQGLFPQSQRTYRIVKIDDRTGTVKSVKIRELSA